MAPRPWSSTLTHTLIGKVGDSAMVKATAPLVSLRGLTGRPAARSHPGDDERSNGVTSKSDPVE